MYANVWIVWMPTDNEKNVCITIKQNAWWRTKLSIDYVSNNYEILQFHIFYFFLYIYIYSDATVGVIYLIWSCFSAFKSYYTTNFLRDIAWRCLNAYMYIIYIICSYIYIFFFFDQDDRKRFSEEEHRLSDRLCIAQQ